VTAAGNLVGRQLGGAMLGRGAAGIIGLVVFHIPLPFGQ
jgi:hypothetical protein